MCVWSVRVCMRVPENDCVCLDLCVRVCDWWSAGNKGVVAFDVCAECYFISMYSVNVCG